MSGEKAHDEFVPRVEDDHVSSKRLWVTTVVAACVVVIALFVADRMMRAAEGPASAASSASPPRAPNQIGIVEQTLIRDTRRGLDERATQQESLAHFRWVDRAHGVAGIPIDQAMDLVADPAFMRRAFVREVSPDRREGDGGP
jgi:hypothetical protein